MSSLLPLPATRAFSLRLFKFALVAAFLYVLGRRGLLSLEAYRKALSNGRELFVAYGLSAGIVTLSALRWKWLLVAQGVRLSFGEALRLGLVGNFFNLALPGGVTGDVVKALQVRSSGKTESATAVMGSIFVDRIVGMAGLILLAALALIASPRGELAGARFAGARLFLFGASTTMAVLFGYVVWVTESRDRVLSLLRRIGSRWSRLGPIARFYLALRAYHRHPYTLLGTLTLSTFIHLLGGLACFHLAVALGEFLPLASLIFAFSLGTVVNVVPLAPAGIGTGHAAFLYLFSLLGSPRGADLYTLVAATAILWAAVGGLVYAFSPVRKHGIGEPASAS